MQTDQPRPDRTLLTTGALLILIALVIEFGSSVWLQARVAIFSQGNRWFLAIFSTLGWLAFALGLIGVGLILIYAAKRAR